MYIGDVPLDIGGGGSRVFVDYIFYVRKKTILFSGEHQTIFLCFTEEQNMRFCLPFSVRDHLLVYSCQHIFHQFRQQPFFSSFSTNFLWRQFSPPPRI